MNSQERTALLLQIRQDAQRIAGAFQLNYRGIVAEHPRVKSRYGACYADGLIKIRLNHARTGKSLKYSSLIDTLCHELAHLRHFNHGPQFKRFFLRLLAWARREGIYRPGPLRGRYISGLRAGEVLRRPASAGRMLENQGSPLRSVTLPYRGPRQRNGVPVFVSEVPSSVTEHLPLPWERAVPERDVAGINLKSDPTPPPTVPASQVVKQQVQVQASPDTTKPVRPVQLSLFPL